MTTGRTQRDRPAWTLVELVLAAGIASVVLAMLLAAVQQARSAAARVSCANNLRQIGMALTGYHSTNQSLPPAVITPNLPPEVARFPDDPFPLLNWPARLLPYLEQDSRWQEVVSYYAAHPMPTNAAPAVAFETVALFQCPADPPRVRWDPGIPLKGPTSYAGVAGDSTSAKNGLLYIDSRVRFADVTDGLSNTILVGERPSSIDVKRGRYFGGWGFWMSCDSSLGVQETHIPPDDPCLSIPPPYQPSSLSAPCSDFHFWSFHRGGAQFALADGSVRFIPYSSAVLSPLATRAGEDF